ncbi:hypothetical protein nbrc107696_31270 [Gordonia spumicola]|uniref:Novel STAND NTPase 1 domain-containing protein n=1 Tax=Gordonia spumicola TaxID=589161 RepID=A0A7I9VC10_9ACTN|nr:hypothetical protein [Gordonia spumicola]GEE02681.1 hypothetical protein nbrc107696_31270 [Gordonia spumicola]
MHPEAVSSREELGRALTDLRVAADLSVRDVASAADALQGTVAGWFAGQHAPTRASRDMFERVLSVCGVPDAAGHDMWWAAVQRTGRRGGRRKARTASPYPGLDPLGPDDGRLFFGRDDQVARLVEIVTAQARARRDDLAGSGDAAAFRAALVVGSSGVGKSSLVRAGLMAETAEGRALDGWHAVVFTPGDDPAAALRTAVAAVPSDAASPLIVIVDQMEELWTQAGADALVAYDAAFAEVIDGRVVIPVGVLRADFYGRAAEMPGLAGVLADAQLVVPPMDREQMRRIITGPAAVADLVVDDELVELLLDDVAPTDGSRQAGAGVLPLLSYALRAVWERSDGRHLTLADYVATGRISGAVELAAERVYADFAPADRVVARRTLLSMVNVDEDTVSRRPVRLADLDAADTSDPVARVLDAFADARLITVTATHAQFAHEALLTAWPRLGEWLDGDRERLLLHRRLRTLQETWESNGRPDGLLPERGRLEVFETLPDSELSQANREFLASARAADAAKVDIERRRTAQLRRAALFATVFGVVALIAAVTAVVFVIKANDQTERADRARMETASRQIAVQADQLRDRDPLLAAQLAMVAYRQSPTVEARSTLSDTLSGSVPIRFAGDGGSTLLAQAPGRIVAAGGSGQVRVFTADEHGITAQIGDFRAGDTTADKLIGGIALSSDGATVYLGGRGAVNVWDITDAKRPVKKYSLTDVTGDANALALSPDGRTLAATVTGTGLHVWTADAAGGWTRVALPDKVMGVDGAVTFSADSRSMASSTATHRIDLWRVDGGRITDAGQIALSGTPNQLAQGLSYLPDGRLAAALRSRTVDVYDVSDPAAPKLTTQFTGFTSWARSVRSDATGSHLLTTGSDNSVSVYDVAAPADPPRRLPTAANSSAALFVGDHVIVASDDGRVMDWPPARNVLQVGTKNVFQVPATPSGSRMFAADPSDRGKITQWRLVDGAYVSAGPDLVPPDGTVYSGAVVTTPDGRWLAIGSADGTVAFADVSDPARPHVVGSTRAETGLNETVDYSPVSHLAVTGGVESRIVTIIDAHDPTRPRTVGTFDAGGGVWWTSLSPDGTSMAVATTTGQVRLVDVSRPDRPLAHPDPLTFKAAVLSTRFDSTGRRLVATSEDRVVAVADIGDPTSPRETARLTGPAGQPYSAAFSPDGRHLIAGGSNSEIWVWSLDGDTPSEAMVIHSFPGNVYDVRFIGDGAFLASGAGGRVESWTLDPDALIDAECARLGDEITETEWDTYVPGLPYSPPCP